MALPVRLDPVGEAPQAPVLALLDLTAAAGDDLGELVGELVHLGGRDVLACDEHALVVRHCALLVDVAPRASPRGKAVCGTSASARSYVSGRLGDRKSTSLNSSH